MTFSLSLTYYDMMLFIILLQRFIYMRAIQTSKIDSINQRYQIIVIMLKNCSRRYSSYYIIKFIGFIPIYYVINLYIILSYLVFNYLYRDLSIYYKFELIIIFFISKKYIKLY